MLVSPPPQAPRGTSEASLSLCGSRRRKSRVSVHIWVKEREGTIDVDDLSCVFLCSVCGSLSKSGKELVGSIWFFRVSMAISTVAVREKERRFSD